MPTQDTSQIKEKIISTLRNKGPNFPIHIAKEIETNTLFTSAFLSELFNEKKIKISSLRVGNSPVYFIEGQEPLLEKFSIHLKSKEKEAFNLLKEKKFLKDEEQNPPIRVALREIKDFAIPFKKENDIFWRYLTIPETEFISKNKKETKIEPEKKIEKEIIKENKIEKKEENKKQNNLNIFEKPQKNKEIKKTVKKRKNSQKKNDKFFNKVKEFLSQKSIKILDIENFNKDYLTLRIIENEKEQLLIAYNKKRITEKDLIKAHKIALESNLKYIILSLGETPKKLKDLLSAIKNLSEIKKLES
jgi:hypothetical protein